MKMIETTTHIGQDGILRLEVPIDEPGQDVEVTVLVQPRRTSQGWFKAIERARADLEAAGHAFRTQEDIDAEIADLRAERLRA